MLYASIVAYTSLIVILYLVDQQALAHAIMVTGPLIMLCWVGMKTVVLLSTILEGLVVMAEGVGSVVQRLQLYTNCIVELGRGMGDGVDWDEILKNIQEDDKP